MAVADHSWNSITCLVSPTPEHETSIELLSEAADAIIAGDVDLSRNLIRQADLPDLYEFAAQVMGGRHPDMPRKRPVSEPVPGISKVLGRMPTRKEVELLYARDGWRCRFCDCRVVSPIARTAMKAAVPGAFLWGKTEGYHGAFYALSATPDHVVAHSAGGTNELENLVTACWPCQFAKGDSTLEQYGLLDPRDRPPIIDSWDGLTRLLKRPGGRAAIVKVQTMRPISPRRTSQSAEVWFASLDTHRPGASRRLIDFLEGCADLGASWSLVDVLLVQMKLGGHTLNVVGIQSSGLCEIPWSIEDAKDKFKAFAETLAAGIPGAIFYETAKTWTVARPQKKRIDVLDLLDASTALRQALETLQSSYRAD